MQTMHHYSSGVLHIVLGCEVPTAVVMNSSVFWDIKLCSPLKVNRVSEEHLTSISRVKKQVKQDTCMKLAANKDLTFNELYSVVSQKIELFTHHYFLQLPQITTYNLFVMNYEARFTIFTHCIHALIVENYTFTEIKFLYQRCLELRNKNTNSSQLLKIMMKGI
jgi:hypothetical protein